MLSHGSDKENSRQLTGSKGHSSASLLNWNRKKKRDAAGAKRLGGTFSLSFGSIRDNEAMY